MKIAVLGTGMVGRALATRLAQLHHQVSLGTRDPDASKVLIDIANPLDFSAGFPPSLLVAGDDSLGEQIQAAFPDTQVVKTLNTLTADLMVHPELLSEPTTVFLSGNSAEAKQLVHGLLTELGHQDILDLGDITTARGTEQYLPLWVRAFGALGTGIFNIKVVR